MMSNVLALEQREQAGSDSYNRFEYQVHWIVCHIIDKLENDTECIVFCEFHDDMAEYSEQSKQYQFYQIKTKESNKEWTIAEMSKREKKNNGEHKKSFLGFIFYNFLNFGTECSCCRFVSNTDYDKDIRSWQSYIEDDKLVKDENIELYQKIKNRIKEEYNSSLPLNFDEIFDVFIQKTFVIKSELQLSTYESQTTGDFFDKLADRNIPVNTAHFILNQLINDVRKKSKEKIKTPISFNSLVNKKGIVINDVREKIDYSIGKKGNYNEFCEYLLTQGLTYEKMQEIESAKTLHDTRWLDITDIKYQEIVLTLRKFIYDYINTMGSGLKLTELKEKCKNILQEKNLMSNSLDETLIEVLYYEQRFNKDS